MSKSLKMFTPLLLSAISLHAGMSLSDISGFLNKLDQARESTQLANHAQLLAQYQRQAVQLENEITSARQLVLSGKMLTQHQWTDFVGDITSLNGLVVQGQQFAFGLAQMDQQFRLQYPGFQMNGQPFALQYANWNKGTMGNIMQALQRFGLSNQQVMNNQAIMQQLKAANKTSEGQQMSLQIANDIAVENVNALNRLHAMASVQMKAYADYTGYELSKDQAVMQDSANVLGYAPHNVDQRRY